MTAEGSVHRGLRLSLRLGAAYDLALALFILSVGPAAMARMGAPLPEGAAFYYRLASLPLILLPALYLAAASAREPDPFRPAVLWARGGGGLFLIALTLLHAARPAWLFLGIGLGDLLWGALHAALWRGARKAPIADR